MNYKEYYENQAGSGFPVFRGYANQRGYGLGGMFKTFFKYIMPMFKTHALPALKKGAEIIGAEAVKTAANIANDAISGKNVKDAAKEHLNEAVNTLSTRAQQNLQRGSGVRRKRKLNINDFTLKSMPRNIFKNRKIPARRIRDIFDS